MKIGVQKKPGKCKIRRTNNQRSNQSTPVQTKKRNRPRGLALENDGPLPLPGIASMPIRGGAGAEAVKDAEDTRIPAPQAGDGEHHLGGVAPHVSGRGALWVEPFLRPRAHRRWGMGRGPNPAAAGN